MFYDKVKKAGEEGLLIFIKWGLVILLAYVILLFGTNVINGSNNGTQAALYLNELQNKGWLPPIVNGQVPDRVKTDEKTNP